LAIPAHFSHALGASGTACAVLAVPIRAEALMSVAVKRGLFMMTPWCHYLMFYQNRTNGPVTLQDESVIRLIAETPFFLFNFLRKFLLTGAQRLMLCSGGLQL
jgi:hypothetical protein